MTHVSFLRGREGLVGRGVERWKRGGGDGVVVGVWRWVGEVGKAG